LLVTMRGRSLRRAPFVSTCVWRCSRRVQDGLLLNRTEPPHGALIMPGQSVVVGDQLGQLLQGHGAGVVRQAEGIGKTAAVPPG
jgi:hypothetical protein